MRDKSDLRRGFYKDALQSKKNPSYEERRQTRDDAAKREQDKFDKEMEKVIALAQQPGRYERLRKELEDDYEDLIATFQNNPLPDATVVNIPDDVVTPAPPACRFTEAEMVMLLEKMYDPAPYKGTIFPTNGDRPFTLNTIGSKIENNLGIDKTGTHTTFYRKSDTSLIFNE
jgi:hypothetical protein